MEELMKKAWTGDRAAQAELAIRMLSGHDGPLDWPTGMRWLIRAAEAGDRRATELLDELQRVAARHVSIGDGSGDLSSGPRPPIVG